ncbi:MAG: phytanoyl-CoA dioxygenase family protein [Gammaproteobacteria bacterium]
MRDYSLTNKHVAEFDKQGFIALPGQTPKRLFTLLDKAASKLIETLCLQNDNLDNVSISFAKTQRFICRINDLYLHPYPEFLLLLGCPQLLDVAYSLCGNHALPMYESLMIRTLGDESCTGLHQDMIHDRASRIATFCLYLDDATPGDGSVRVIPESQHEKHNLNQFDELCRNKQWSFHNLTARAGDLILHDVMTIHDSPALTMRKQRRTIYLEFRSLDHLSNNPRFSDEWIARRIELVKIAQNKHSAFLEGKSFELNEKEKIFFSALYQSRIQIEPANYPIPSF